MKIMVINRSFWPTYPVIGEALLQFSEKASQTGHIVSVVTQDNAGIKLKLKESGRGQGVSFYPIKALSTSASGVWLRSLDAIFFMSWVVILLLWVRPKKIYVSTDPPIVVPFISMVYCKFFGADYIYHLQDIHPEAANVLIPINKFLFKALAKIDTISLRRATRLITITEQMATEIRLRSGTTAPIYTVSNPSVSFSGIDNSRDRIDGFAFCGNAGRFQRIPLMLEAIEEYFNRGGLLEFTFAGGGYYAGKLEAFASKFPLFHYSGLVSSVEAAQINSHFTWALLPIEDDVTRFSFPSKSSSYVCANANILAICGENTCVATWVKKNKIGLVVKPEIEAIINEFFAIENGLHDEKSDPFSREALKAELSFEVFIESIENITMK